MDSWSKAFLILIVGGLANYVILPAIAVLLFLVVRFSREQNADHKRKLRTAAVATGIACLLLVVGKLSIPKPASIAEAEELHKALVTPIVDKLNELNGK